jgi:hypothetical protein
MKPETKRWLAKEWLILLGCAGVVFIAVSLSNYPKAHDGFWGYTKTGQQICNNPTLPASIVPPDRRRYLASYEEKEEQAKAWGSYVAQLPSSIRTQAFLFGIVTCPLEALNNATSAVWFAVAGLYLLLWIPRLTTRAVRTLASKPEGEAPKS